MMEDITVTENITTNGCYSYKDLLITLYSLPEDERKALGETYTLDDILNILNSSKESIKGVRETIEKSINRLTLACDAIDRMKMMLEVSHGKY